MKIYIIIAFFLYFNSFAQITNKDFKTTDLKKEGVTGQLLIKASKQQDLDSIIHYASKALDLSIKNKDQGLQAFAYYRLGTAYIYKEDLVLSEKNILKCLSIAKKNKLKNFLIESYRMLGIIAGEKYDFNSCINYFIESLKFATDPQDIISIKINIAVVYINSNKNNLAYEILTEVIHFYNNYKGKDLNKDFLSVAYVNLSTVAPTFKERFEAVNKAIELSKDTKDYDIQTAMLLKKGELLLSNKQYDKAYTVLKSAYKESKKWDYNLTATSCLIGLAKLNYKTNSFNAAAAYMDTLLNHKLYDLKLSIPSKTIDSLAHLVYYKNKDYDKAFVHAEKYIKYQDSIINNKEDLAYAEYGKKYQTETKIRENKLLKNDLLIKELEVDKEKNIRYIFGVIALLSLITIFFIYNRNKLKTKNNLILKEKNKIIINQNKLLETANATKQKLFTIISHDLINPFNTLMGYSKIVKDDYESLDDDSRKKYIDIINNAATTNHTLVKNLLDWSRTQQENITVNKQWCNAHQLLIEASNPYLQVASKKNITIHYPENKEISCFVDKNLMIICLGNLISNAIKFTPLNGEIKFSADKDEFTFYITITDSGIGLPKEQQENLFVVSSSKSRSGTENEKGTGLGLLICKEIIEMHQGVITVKSEINKGTVVGLCVPIIPKKKHLLTKNT